MIGTGVEGYLAGNPSDIMDDISKVWALCSYLWSEESSQFIYLLLFGERKQNERWLTNSAALPRGR